MLLRPRGGFVQRRAIEQRGQHPLCRAPLRRGRLLFRRQRRKIEHHRIFALIRLGIGVERGDDFRGQAAQQQTMEQRLQGLEASNARKLEEMRKTLAESMAALQAQNAQKLDEIRHTVDEQLQDALQKRVTESFKAVNDQLEQVYKGLGEMDPEQLWETTMEPSTRTMLQVSIEDAAEAERVVSELMGDQVEPRKGFIQKHAHDVRFLDF